MPSVDVLALPILFIYLWNNFFDPHTYQFCLFHIFVLSLSLRIKFSLICIPFHFSVLFSFLVFPILYLSSRCYACPLNQSFSFSSVTLYIGAVHVSPLPFYYNFEGIIFAAPHPDLPFFYSSPHQISFEFNKTCPYTVPLLFFFYTSSISVPSLTLFH